MRLLDVIRRGRILVLVFAIALVGCGASTTPGPVAANQLGAYPTLTPIVEPTVTIAPNPPSFTTTTTPMQLAPTVVVTASPTVATSTVIATSTVESTSTPVTVPTISPLPTIAPTLAPSPTIAPAKYRVLASVSSLIPRVGASVTVTGRLVDAAGRGVAGATMRATWHNKPNDATCNGRTTKSDGRSSCSRKIGGADSGYTVVIDVVFTTVNGQQYAGSTSVTPR